MKFKIIFEKLEYVDKKISSIENVAILQGICYNQ